MNPQAIVWTIAGSDASGGAGIQSDLKTFHNFSVQACSVITAITAQNLQKFTHLFPLPVEQVKAQLSLLPTPAAIKIGMLADVPVIQYLHTFLMNYTGFVVLDPMLISSSGANLFCSDQLNYIEHLKSLFEAVSLLTPNKHEAEMLVQRKINNYNDVIHAAQDLLAMGVKSVLIKGGHFNNELSHDYWTNGSESCWLVQKRLLQRNCHGTGCVTSAAIAAAVALQYEIKDALVLAKMYVHRGIRLATATDHATLFQHSLGLPDEQIDLPLATTQALQHWPHSFNQQDQFNMGLYPVVDNAAWLTQLLPLGIKHIQLRVKDLQGEALYKEIQDAIAIAKQYDAKLFINDYWQLAIQYGAYGVHLGQEDLLDADIAAIHRAGLRLGISTHCYYEVARAHACQPSYMASGPIYHTNSKIMSFAPQGLAALARWRKILNYPLVAIGGINIKNINDVLAQGVDGAALISAITQAPDASTAAINLMQEVNHHAA